MAEEKPLMTIVYFCFGDKWQDWEKRGFANRTASVARELALHPRVKRLIVVNNPTSYPALWFKRSFGKTSKAVRRFRDLAETTTFVNAGMKDEHVRKTIRFGMQRYLLEEINKCVSVIEQVRLLPKERSNRFKFAFNNAIFDRALIRMLKSLVSSGINGQVGIENAGNGQSTNDQLVLWLSLIHI
jgi:hypothetical protein